MTTVKQCSIIEFTPVSTYFWPRLSYHFMLHKWFFSLTSSLCKALRNVLLQLCQHSRPVQAFICISCMNATIDVITFFFAGRLVQPEAGPWISVHLKLKGYHRGQSMNIGILASLTLTLASPVIWLLLVTAVWSYQLMHGWFVVITFYLLTGAPCHQLPPVCC